MNFILMNFIRIDPKKFFSFLEVTFYLCGLLSKFLSF